MQTDNPDTIPMDIEPVRITQPLGVKFTGSGSEYFRIWMVNLLLTLVTFGIYYPWAKARKLRYFRENTEVGGDPLGFHGSGAQFFRGNMIAGLLLFVYSVAAQASPAAALVALVILAAIWPALLRASLCFRLRNTSWRGVRFEFKGSLAGAYVGVLPLWIPAIALVAAGAMGPEALKGAQAAWLIVPALVSTLALPAAFYGFKRYQHGNFGLGGERTQLTAKVGSFYVLGLKVFGVYVLACVAFGLAFAGFAAVGLFQSPGTTAGQTANLLAPGLVGLVSVPVILLVGALIFSFLQSRLQNLVWGNTRSAHIKFSSDLRLGWLTGIRLKNWLLIGLTLGLYWPFAAVSLYRLRVESVSAESTMDLAALVDTSFQHYDNAAGDAAGDFFGLDLGL